MFIAGDLAEALKLPASGGLADSEKWRAARRPSRPGCAARQRRGAVGNARLGVGGDLITAIDGKPVKEQDAVTRAISRKHAGDDDGL